MAGKHDTVESARRPLALHKLSGLINRGAGKTKRVASDQQPQVVAAPAPAAAAPVPAAGAAPSADKAASIFRLKARKKDPSPEAGARFQPLEVDLNTLSSYRLADGWLDDKPKPKPDADRESDKENQSPRRSRERATSSTPIADLYAGQSAKAASPTSTSPSIKGPSQHRGAARPFSFIRPSSPTYGRKSLDSPRHLPSRGGSILDRPRPVEPSESVLERGRPVEPSRLTGTEPEDAYRIRAHSRPTNSWRDYMPKQPQVPQASTATIRMVPPSAGPDDDYDPFRSDDSGSATYDPFRADAATPKPGHLRGRESLDATNRHSMYAVVPSPMGSRPGTANRAPPPNRAASDQPLDRIRTWQKSVTSAPSTAGAPAPGALPARSLSKRGVGNRLAWIRELEDKKASGAGAGAPPPGGFKKPSGSVADRLRMFEVKKNEAAAAASAAAPPVVPRLPPLSRTNSTASRLSSVGFDAATTSSACDNATATPRTSIDSVRTSNRASSVMSYYDPSFREKMEGLVSSYADKDDETKKQKVKAAFVPVMSPKKEEAAETAEAAKAEETKVEETKVEDQSESKPEEAVEKPEEAVEKPEEAVEKPEEAVEKPESKPEEVVAKPEMPAVEKEEEKSEPAAAAPIEVEAKSEEKAEDKPETVEPVAQDKVQPAPPTQEPEATPAPDAEAAKAAELPQPVVEEAPAPAVVEAPAAETEEKASAPAPQTVEEPAVVAATATEEAAKEEAPVVAAAAGDEAYQPETEGVAEEIQYFKPEKCTLINE